MATKAPAPMYPFNDDEIRADPAGYAGFLAHSAIGHSERASARARQIMSRAKKRARRRA